MLSENVFRGTSKWREILFFTVVYSVALGSTHPGFLPRVKRLGREADHISPLSVDVKNEKRSTSDHSVFLRGVIRDNCNFLHRHIYRQRLTVTPSPVVTNRKG